MQLLASWRDSLTVFRPENFKLFLLVTLKSLKEGYGVWLKYWGWFVGLYFLIGLFQPGVNIYLISIFLDDVFPFFSDTVTGVTTLYALFIIVTLVLSFRPSMHIKNYSYFKGFIPHQISVVAWFFCVSVLYYVTKLSFGETFLVDLVYSFVMGTLSLFFMLFLFDSDASLNQALSCVIRAFKMIVYNLPAILIGGVILFTFLNVLVLEVPYSLEMDVLWIRRLRMVLFVMVCAPITVCTVTNFYVKRLHEQFGVYFN